MYKKSVAIPRKSDLNSQKEFIEYYKNLKNNLKLDFATKSCFLNVIDTLFYEMVHKIAQELSPRITDNFQIFPDTKQKI